MTDVGLDDIRVVGADTRRRGCKLRQLIVPRCDAWRSALGSTSLAPRATGVPHVRVDGVPHPVA